MARKYEECLIDLDDFDSLACAGEEHQSLSDKHKSDEGRGESKAKDECIPIKTEAYPLPEMMDGLMKRMSAQEALLLNLSRIITQRDEIKAMQFATPAKSINVANTSKNPFLVEANLEESILSETNCPPVRVKTEVVTPIDNQNSAILPPTVGSLFNPNSTVCVMPVEWLSRIGIDPIATLAPFEFLPDDMFGVERFIADFQALIDEYKFPESRSRSILETKMQGRARSKYFAGLGNNNYFSLKERLDELIILFSLKPSKKELKKLFQSCVHVHGERVGAYKARLLALAEPLKPPPQCSQVEYEESLFEQFKDGVLPYLRLEIIRNQPQTFKEAFAFAVSMEKQLKGQPQLDEQINDNMVLTHELAKQVESLKHEFSSYCVGRPNPAPNKPTVLTCRYCNKPGHIERYCRKKVTDNEALNAQTVPSPVAASTASDNSLNTNAPRS